MKTAIVKLEDMSIASTYHGEARQHEYGGPWARPDMYAHVEWDETVLGQHVVAQDDGEGGVELVKDVQKDREAKLALMRMMREPKLKEADLMINDLVVGDRDDHAAVQLYRNQLKGITDSYKDEQGAATDALDSLESDLSDLAWPAKP